MPSTTRRARRSGEAVEHRGQGGQRPRPRLDRPQRDVPAPRTPRTRSDHDLHRVFQQLGEPGEPASPSVPSTGRWSTDSTSFRIEAISSVSLSPTTGLRTAAPTARIPACGGLMIASNSSIPNMPRLLTVSVPPCSSAVDSLPAFARPTASLIFADSAEIDSEGDVLDHRRDQPFSLATATATSAAGPGAPRPRSTPRSSPERRSAPGGGLHDEVVDRDFYAARRVELRPQASSASTRADLRR